MNIAEKHPISSQYVLLLTGFIANVNVIAGMYQKPINANKSTLAPAETYALTVCTFPSNIRL